MLPPQWYFESLVSRNEKIKFSLVRYGYLMCFTVGNLNSQTAQRNARTTTGCVSWILMIHGNSACSGDTTRFVGFTWSCRICIGTKRKWWEILRAWDMNRMCILGANRDSTTFAYFPECIPKILLLGKCMWWSIIRNIFICDKKNHFVRNFQREKKIPRICR